MAALMRPAARMNLYEVAFLCGHKCGVRQVWAPSEKAARRLIVDHASVFGLQHERVYVRSVTRLFVRDQSVLVPDERGRGQERTAA